MRLSDFFQFSASGSIRVPQITTDEPLRVEATDDRYGATFTESGDWTAPSDGVVFVSAIGGGGSGLNSNSGGDTVVTFSDGRSITCGGGMGYGSGAPMMSGAVSSSGFDISFAAKLSGLEINFEEDLPSGTSGAQNRPFPFGVPFPSTSATGLPYSRSRASYGHGSYGGGGGGAGVNGYSGDSLVGYFGGYGRGRSEISAKYGGAGGGVILSFAVQVASGEVIAVNIGAGGLGTGTFNYGRGGDGICTILFVPRV